MVITPPGYRSMSEAEKRAVRRRISEEISQRDESSTPAVVSPASDPAERVLLGARAELEALERGDDSLMGMPRHLVDFTAAYAAIDAQLDHARRSPWYSPGISAR